MTCAINQSVDLFFGTPYCWGAGDEYQTGTGSLADEAYPHAVLGNLNSSGIVAGTEWGCALARDSIPHCWGGSVTGLAKTSVPVSTRKYTAIFGASKTLCGIDTDSLASCGFPRMPMEQNPSHPNPVSTNLKFTMLAPGYSHVCGIAQDSTAYCWGYNRSGELGDGTEIDRSSPTPVAGGMKFLSIAAGFLFTCAIAAETSVGHCWGNNWNGSLGRPGGNSSVPVPITGDLTLAQVTVGSGHACGISLSGKAHCWGSNEYGQLGDGTTVNRFAPVLVSGQR
jgi:alpha-tubulin suppressor-like RCC1 family protein